MLVCSCLFVPFGSTPRGNRCTLGYSRVLQCPSGGLVSGTPPIRFDAVVTLVHLATAEDNESVALQVLSAGRRQATVGACLRLRA